ncbi:hypothetical protein N658DRAFT_433133, partial [Parathielavia hyrcaniae]
STVDPCPAASRCFWIPAHAGDYHAGASTVAHTRSSTSTSKLSGTTYHTPYGFADRSVEETTATMVGEPCAQPHVHPAGGVGRAELAAFFTATTSSLATRATRRWELVSRMAGIDRAVPFNCTHGRVIDFMAVWNHPAWRTVAHDHASSTVRTGNRLYHEHIAWDQSSVLQQPWSRACSQRKSPAVSECHVGGEEQAGWMGSSAISSARRDQIVDSEEADSR